MLIAWVLGNTVPYHLARAAAARAAGLDLHLIEICGIDHFRALETDATGDKHRTVLYPGLKYEQVPRKAQRVKTALDTIEPDVVCISGWSEGGAIAALRWAIKHRTAVVMMSESTAYDSPRVWWKEWVKRRIVRRCGGFLVGGTDHVAYIKALLGGGEGKPGYERE